MPTAAWLSPLRAWLRFDARSLDDVPRPTDRPVASSPGSPAIECLALGNGPIASWGVASHQVGLVGALARSLGRRFGHGAVVRAAIHPDRTVRGMIAAAKAQPWETAQVGVVSFGPHEVLASASVPRWTRDLDRLLRLVRERMPDGSWLTVLAIPVVPALSVLGAGSARIARLVTRYNAAAAAVCAAIEGVRFVPLPPPVSGRTGRYRTAEDYAAWAEIVVAALPGDPVAVRPPAAEEQLRAATVERLGLLDTPPEERFDRVVRLARSVFRTRAAGFSLVHGDRHWFKAGAGVRMTELPREASLCDIVVGQGGPLVVGDAAADPRFADSHFARVAKVRFYAGYPLRAPDGNFVGALCVYDEAPRDPADVDVATLRELALMIESELEFPIRARARARRSGRPRVRAS